MRRKGSGLIYTPLKSASLDSTSFVPMTGPESVQSIDAMLERVVVSEPLEAGEARHFSVVRVALP